MERNPILLLPPECFSRIEAGYQCQVLVKATTLVHCTLISLTSFTFHSFSSHDQLWSDNIKPLYYRVKQLLKFKLCAILSSVMKFCSIPHGSSIIYLSSVSMLYRRSLFSCLLFPSVMILTIVIYTGFGTIQDFRSPPEKIL